MKLRPNKPLVIYKGKVPQVEDLKHQKGSSGRLQDQMIGKPRIDPPDLIDKAAFERGFIKAATDNGIDIFTATKLLKEVK